MRQLLILLGVITINVLMLWNVITLIKIKDNLARLHYKYEEYCLSLEGKLTDECTIRLTKE
jgi:hypothetical protein